LADGVQKSSNAHFGKQVIYLRLEATVEQITQADRTRWKVENENNNVLNLDTGWLVIFDRRPDLSPISDLTTERALSPAGRTITGIRG
jgi:hypothetical protein